MKAPIISWLILSETRRKRWQLLALLAITLIPIRVIAEPPLLLQKPNTVSIVNAPSPDHSIPHDNTFFTQGLVYDDGTLYESTGLYGESKLVAINASNGEILRSKTVSDAYFAEGLAIKGNKLYQLTWKSGKGFIYDKDTFEILGEFSYPGEGWGFAHHNNKFWLTDGTTKLRTLDEKLDFNENIILKYNNKNINNTNEIEWINGKIWANVWQTNAIIVINPETGIIEKQINFNLPLPEDSHPEQDVLNGIAYDDINKNIYITGKLYNKIYIYKLNSLK